MLEWIHSNFHEVIDDDTHFVIDPVTRTITNPDSDDIVLMQYDHNSEIFTFEIPRVIEGHDILTTSAMVQIHFRNISLDGKESSSGLSMASPRYSNEYDGGKTVLFSWSIPKTATMYNGILAFAIRIACLGNLVDHEFAIEYDWHTEIFAGIPVLETIDNSDSEANVFKDLLSQYKDELSESLVSKVTEQLNTDMNSITSKVTILETNVNGLIANVEEMDDKLNQLQNNIGSSGTVENLFDGELFFGYWATGEKYETYQSDAVSCVNFIPCSETESITIKLPEVFDIVQVEFYDSNNSYSHYLSYQNTSEVTIDLTSSEAYGSLGAKPSHIRFSVYINVTGTDAVELKDRLSNQIVVFTNSVNYDIDQLKTEIKTINDRLDKLESSKSSGYSISRVVPSSTISVGDIVGTAASAKEYEEPKDPGVIVT